MRSDAELTEAFKTGKGIEWGDHHECLFCGTEKFFRPSYASNLTQNWIPALNGVKEKLERGATVADVGCGHGCSTTIMAKAFPNSQFIGFDLHQPSIERARELAAEQGITNVQFKVASAQDFPKPDQSDGYDFITVFDALHDMGDPKGAAKQASANLKPDGTCMIVEPAAGDDLADNLHPVGRVYYSFSAAVCIPSALSQPGGASLGAQAGPAALRSVLTTKGGFSNVEVAMKTPFNIVLEATR
jgi:SAM-dependent methyltransferase